MVQRAYSTTAYGQSQGYRRKSNRFWITIVGVMGSWLGTMLIQSQASVKEQSVKTVKVLFVGGSIAKGEQDPNGNGYLQRAFRALTHNTYVKYQYTDKAIVGANSTQLATMYKGTYDAWLDEVKPQVVVISWGLLNDALPHTPMSDFKHYLREEISQALNRKAVVFVVTPPITKATYTKFPTQERMYSNGEIQLVKQMHNPNVLAFDIFGQMQRYLATHHQTYVPYTADPNHPNTAGHVLAGRLLYKDILRKFGNRLIQD